jgi:hypothetical protein
MITHTSSGRWWAMMPLHTLGDRVSSGYKRVSSVITVSELEAEFPLEPLSSESTSVCTRTLKFVGVHDCLQKSRLIKNQDSLLSAAPDVGEFGAVRSYTG